MSGIDFVGGGIETGGGGGELGERRSGEVPRKPGKLTSIVYSGSVSPLAYLEQAAPGKNRKQIDHITAPLEQQTTNQQQVGRAIQIP